mgnify:CR=1 FL=1
MIPGSIRDAIASVVTPNLTKESVVKPQASFQYEDGTVSIALHPRIEGGVAVPLNCNDKDDVASRRVKSVNQSAKVGTYAKVSESYSKLGDGANLAFRRLVEHVYTLASPTSGN